MRYTPPRAANCLGTPRCIRAPRGQKGGENRAPHAMMTARLERSPCWRPRCGRRSFGTVLPLHPLRLAGAAAAKRRPPKWGVWGAAVPPRAINAGWSLVHWGLPTTRNVPNNTGEVSNSISAHPSVFVIESAQQASKCDHSRNRWTLKRPFKDPSTAL